MFKPDAQFLLLRRVINAITVPFYVGKFHFLYCW